MGALAPSLRLASPRVPPNAAVVLAGNFDVAAHAFEARAGDAPVALSPTEIWTPLVELNPGNERWFLLRPAAGEWPAGATLSIDVRRAEPPCALTVVCGPERSELSGWGTTPPRLQPSSQCFSVVVEPRRAEAPPAAFAIGAPYVRTDHLPIFGERRALFIPHEAMRSIASPVLWLEVELLDARGALVARVAGAIEANAPGSASAYAYEGVARAGRGRVVDTAGNETVFGG